MSKNVYPALLWTAPLVLGVALLGCASTDTGQKTPTPQQDFQEFRQLVVASIARVDATLRALDNLAAQANGNPRTAYEAFSKAVQRLDVDSIHVREHLQAMRARGDAYFEHWDAWLATVNNEGVGQRAAEHREALKQSFEALRAAAQQVREGFRPFLSDLEKLCAVLDEAPTLAHIDAQKTVILAADEKGKQVQQNLERILAEMNTMTGLLRAPEATAEH
jgi:hypothetical protein